MRIISMTVMVLVTILMFSSGCAVKKFAVIGEPVPKSQGYYVDYGYGMEKYEDIISRYPGVRKAYDVYPHCDNSSAFNSVIPLSGNRRIKIGWRLTPSEQQLGGLVAIAAEMSIGGLKFAGNGSKYFDEVSIRSVEDQSDYKKGYTLFVYDLDPACDLYIMQLGASMGRDDAKVLIFRK